MDPQKCMTKSRGTLVLGLVRNLKIANTFTLVRLTWPILFAYVLAPLAAPPPPCRMALFPGDKKKKNVPNFKG